MELKAFGVSSSDPDLSKRTDALTDYAANKLGMKTPVSSFDDSGSQTDTAQEDSVASGDSAASGGSAYPHITALEQAILAQTYPNDALPDRLSRMETKAFGAPSTNQDLSDRTDALEQYAEKKLHKNPLAQAEGVSPGAVEQQQQRGPGRSKQLLASLGGAMLGFIPGFSGVNTQPGLVGMPGFSGIGMQPRSAQPPQDNPDNPQQDMIKAEEPAMHAATPPPPSAKLITKVGWCEVQTFGHDFSKMHLAERLDQLNGELNFDPRQKGADLMDDIDKLVSTVQARHPLATKTGVKPAI
ncbi:MAG: hypothetical protein ACRD3W_16320, partial [Terriglobales bacterium]